LNSVNYAGRLTKDAEVRELKNEKKTKVVYFTIAVQDSFNKERADFINCQAFGYNVNYLNKHGKKGVYIEFSGKTSTYSKDGNFGSIAVADKVTIIFANSKKETQKTEEEEILGEPVF
jgi:single-strand DNA-binding protein